MRKKIQFLPLFMVSMFAISGNGIAQDYMSDYYYAMYSYSVPYQAPTSTPAQSSTSCYDPYATMYGTPYLGSPPTPAYDPNQSTVDIQVCEFPTSQPAGLDCVTTTGDTVPPTNDCYVCDYQSGYPSSPTTTPGDSGAATTGTENPPADTSNDSHNNVSGLTAAQIAMYGDGPDEPPTMGKYLPSPFVHGWNNYQYWYAMWNHCCPPTPSPSNKLAGNATHERNLASLHDSTITVTATGGTGSRHCSIAGAYLNISDYYLSAPNVLAGVRHTFTGAVPYCTYKVVVWTEPEDPWLAEFVEFEVYLD